MEKKECKHEWRKISMQAGRQLRQCDKCGRVESYSPLGEIFG